MWVGAARAVIARRARGALCVIGLLAIVSAACGRDSSPVAPTPPPAVTPPSATPTTFVLSGGVTNKRDGARLVGARIEIVSGVSAGKVATTDAEGRYRIVELPAGEHGLRATADGFDPLSSSVTLTADRTVDFALTRWMDGGSAPEPPKPPDRWTLAGTVTDAAAKSSLAGVRIEVTEGANRGRTATTDEQGRYTLADLEAGTATVLATLGGFVPKSVVVALLADRTLDVALDREAPAPSGPQVTGRTLDVLSDQPLVGVTLRIDGIGETTTSSGGEFTFTAGTSGGLQQVTFSSSSTVERQTHIRVPGESATVTLIPGSLDLRSFDEMFRARGGLHRWVEAPRLVVERRVLTFTNTSDMTYVATADSMTEAEANDLVADLTWALPQLTGRTFTAFAGVTIELANEDDMVAISRPGVIVVARYQGLSRGLGVWGYGRWAWNGAGEVRAGAVMIDNDFEQSGSLYRRSLRSHELGHTLGYDHVSSDTSSMNISARIEPTPFDLDATRIAFHRQPLNQSPDIDPEPTTVNRRTSSRALTWTGER